MIATILATLCRELGNPPLPFRFSRQFSRQSVVSDKAWSEKSRQDRRHSPGKIARFRLN